MTAVYNIYKQKLKVTNKIMTDFVLRFID